MSDPKKILCSCHTPLALWIAQNRADMKALAREYLDRARAARYNFDHMGMQSEADDEDFMLGLIVLALFVLGICGLVALIAAYSHLDPNHHLLTWTLAHHTELGGAVLVLGVDVAFYWWLIHSAQLDHYEEMRVVVVDYTAEISALEPTESPLTAMLSAQRRARWRAGEDPNAMGGRTSGASQEGTGPSSDRHPPEDGLQIRV